MINKQKKIRFGRWCGYSGLVILLIGVGVGVITFLSSPADLNSKEKVSFIIRKGASVDRIGQDLKENGLIKSSAIFKLVILQKGIGKKIQAGSYRLSANMSVSEIANNLTTGRQDIWVTLLEGWRREEIADALEVAFGEVGKEFDKSIFLKETVGKEGMLYPDTYLFPMSASEEVVASVLISTFDERVTKGLKNEILRSSRSLNQILTMASLIEREAADNESRLVVAGILWKRFDNDWPLQVDASLQYAKGFNEIENTWWKPPTAADKMVDSVYNTYTNVGLPPGPISSSSIESIKAAINPKDSEYWFYLTDTKGNIHYGKTVEEHNRNINRYLR